MISSRKRRAQSISASIEVGNAINNDGGEGGTSDTAVIMPFARNIPVGSSLVDALNTMVAEGSITAENGLKILDTFDKTFPPVMKDADQLLVSDRKKKSINYANIELKGTVDNYQRYHDYWRIDATDVELDNGQSVRKIDTARLIFISSNGLGRSKPIARSKT